MLKGCTATVSVRAAGHCSTAALRHCMHAPEEGVHGSSSAAPTCTGCPFSSCARMVMSLGRCKNKGTITDLDHALPACTLTAAPVPSTPRNLACRAKAMKLRD